LAAVSAQADSPPRSTLPALGRRAYRHSLFRFLVSGGLCAALDAGLLFLLHGVIGVQLSVATLVAVMLAFFANFTLNRFWSFGSRTYVGSQFVRYLVLGAANWAFTVLAVTGLAYLGLYYLLAKMITLVVAAAGNYIAYRLWVFRPVPVPVGTVGEPTTD
jgi:putative flippase GtrA